MANQILHILLVEDNPLDVELTLRAFKTQNLSNPIKVARDGEEALEQIHHWESGEVPPAVILLDLKLPKVDGIEVLRRIKSHPRFKVIPLIVLTTSKESIDLQRCYELGANSYIVKPVNFEKFTEVIKQIDLYWLLTNNPPPLV